MVSHDWLESRILAFACAYLHDGAAWKNGRMGNLHFCFPLHFYLRPEGCR